MKHPFLIKLNVLIILALLCLVCARLDRSRDRAVAANTAQVAPAGSEALLNDGFERSGKAGLPEGWQLMPNREGRGDARMDSERAFSGQHSLRLAPNSRNTEEGFGVFKELDPAALRGRQITIAGHAMMSGLGESGAGLMLKTDRTDWIIFPKAVRGRFIDFSKTLRINSNISQAYLFFIVGGRMGSVWLDDLTITADAAADAPAAATAQLVPTPDAYADRINTPGWQDSAFITPGGQELYFAYVRYTNRDLRSILLGEKSPSDIKLKGPIRKGAHAELEFETFKAALQAGGGFGSPVRVYVDGADSFFAAKLSFDGRQMCYVIRDHPGGYGSGDIYASNRIADDRWDAPQNLGPKINTDANEETPCFSADGQTLYFARNRGDGLGFELMSSTKVNGAWAEAQKLPYPVNERNPSRTANHQPFLTSDGKELYFTRIQQLYRSTLYAGGSWGAPVPIFPQLPLSGHASVTADGQDMYFLSAKDPESIGRENWTIWHSRRRPDGLWGEPAPVD